MVASQCQPLEGHVGRQLMWRSSGGSLSVGVDRPGNKWHPGPSTMYSETPFVYHENTQEYCHEFFFPKIPRT